MDTLDQKLLDEIGSFFPAETTEYLDAPAVQQAHDNLKAKTEEYYNLRKENNGDPSGDMSIARLRDEIVGLQGQLIGAIAEEKDRRATPPPGRPDRRAGLKLPSLAMGDASLSKIALAASGISIGVALTLGYVNYQSQAQGRRDTEKRLTGRIDETINKAILKTIEESGRRGESQIQALAAGQQASEKRLQDRLDALEAQVRELKEQTGKRGVPAQTAAVKKKGKKR